MRTTILFTILSLTFIQFALAEDNIIISDAWIREVPPGVTVSAAYMTLNNRGNQADKLTAITSDATENVELHISSVNEKGVAKMERIKALEIPAGESVELKPGGMHLMLIGLKGPLEDSVTINFSFEGSGDIRVEVPVKKTKDSGEVHHHH